MNTGNNYKIITMKQTNDRENQSIMSMNKKHRMTIITLILYLNTNNEKEKKRISKGKSAKLFKRQYIRNTVRHQRKLLIIY